MRLVPVVAAALLVVATLRVPAGGQSTSPSPQAARVSEGATLYTRHCARCHGADGRGGGRDAAAMHFMPGDLTELAMENHGVFPAERMKQIIVGQGPAVHGTRLMPVWGDVFARSAAGGARDRIDALVRYLESIQRRPA